MVLSMTAKIDANTGLRQFGQALIDNGYAIVPIAPGGKFPKLQGWQDLTADKAVLDGWLANGRCDNGVGVITAFTPCVDIDVLDAEVVEAVKAKVFDLIGQSPCRVGFAPKVALYFRTDTPFAKVSSRIFECAAGKWHKVEVLAQGQQSVLYATHVDTGKPYQWSGGGLAEIERKDLVEITQAQAQDLVAWFEDYATALGWSALDLSGGGHVGTGDALANVKQPINAPERIKRALARIDPDCLHDTWVKVGMGLYHEYGGSDDGFNLWHDWSAEGAKYGGEAECLRKWRTFDANLKRTNPVTAATILMLGKREALPEFLERFVYIEQGDLVADLEKPPQHSISRLHEFKNAHANVQEAVPTPTQADPDKVKMMAVPDMWLRHTERLTAQGVVYRPKLARVVDEDGLMWVNKFYMPEHGATYDKAHIDIFLAHMAYMVADKIDCEWFIGWMARLIQNPQQRCHVVPLHISPAAGTGRGWVLRLLRALVGVHNVNNVTMDIFADSPFTGFLADCLVCAIEEAKEEKGVRYRLSEKIKEKVEAPFLLINHKYGKQAVQPVYANVAIFSNHRDAVVLQADERRTYVMDGPDEVPDRDYFTKIYKLLDDPRFVASIFNYLSNLDISHLDFMRPRHNEARARLVEATQSDTEILFNEVMANPPFAAMALADFINYCRERAPSMGLDAFDVNENQLKKLLRLNAFGSVRLKYGGDVKRVWALTKAASSSNDVVREALDAQK